ncbi:nuclear transport factor 2 family protein [Novosphingobium lentum]|uniref:nuclear transport factor 2 family protein n=1 Tax=Novosphingobium lentum TaxID=145287 RepID=UPI000831362B|nr:limonene-1,2-epoxide hydrolase family protein [Novosphingobium lentum]
MSDNANRVSAMLASWQRRDVATIVEFFTEDAIYTNVPIDPPNVGHQQIGEFLTWFFGAVGDLEFTVLRQIEGPDGTVMNERIDRLDFAGKVVELPIMGVFEFRGDRICAWRDYFDMALLDALGTDVSVPR